MRIQFTKVSENRKLGPMATTISSEDTCPPTCPLKGNGCYAEHGPLRWQWDRVGRGGNRSSEGKGGNRSSEGKGGTGGPWGAMLDQIRDVPAGRMFRYGQAGDLPYCGNRSSEVRGCGSSSSVVGEGCGSSSSVVGEGSVEGNTGRLDDGKCMQLAEAARHLHSFLYTHYPVLPSAEVTEETAEHNLAVLNEMSRRKFVVNLSANNLEEADRLAEAGLPVVVVLPAPPPARSKEEYKLATRTPGGRRIVVCPHYTKGVQCIDCKLCARSQRKVIVGFPAHGTGKGKASKVALG